MSQIRVYYNASCPVCRTEIEHYRRISDRYGLAIEYSDISDPSAFCPLDRESMLKRLHVQAGGQTHIGASAFLTLWQRLPYYRWLGKFMELPVIRYLFDKVYDHVLAPGLYAWHKRRSRRQDGIIAARPSK